MEANPELFTVLIICAVILFAVETFVPGGVLGVIGVLALVGAVAVGYTAFPGYGTMIAVAIFIITIVLFVLWLKLLPKTWIAKVLTLSKDLSDAHGANETIASLIDMEGVTLCALHPSGFARIDGKKIDVISEGEMIDKDVKVKVIEVESNRVVVKKI